MTALRIEQVEDPRKRPWLAKRKPQIANAGEREAREECARRGIDPDEICADGGVTAWLVVSKELHREPAPTAAQQIAAAFERRRQPVAIGTYGRIDVIDNAPGAAWLDINNPNVAFSADDCREAAHLLNQIAETLEAQSCA